MKTADLRKLSPEALQQQLTESQTELAQLRFQHAITRLEEPTVLRHKRRDIARLQTIINQGK